MTKRRNLKISILFQENLTLYRGKFDVATLIKLFVSLSWSGRTHKHFAL